MREYVLGYAVSVVIGTVATALVSSGLHRWVTTPKGERNLLLVSLIGVLERIAYTTFIAWDVSGAASFIGAWVSVKAVSGWNSWPLGADRLARERAFVGLCGSITSVLFGVAGGLMIKAALKLAANS